MDSLKPIDYEHYLADEVRAEMKRQNIGVRQLGRLLGINPSLISKHIGSDTRPPTQRPSIEFIKKYADFTRRNFYKMARTKGYSFDALQLIATQSSELSKEIENSSPELKELIQNLTNLSTPLNSGLKEIWVDVLGYQDFRRQVFKRFYKNTRGSGAKGYAEVIDKLDIDTWTDEELDEAIWLYDSVWQLHGKKYEGPQTPELIDELTNFIDEGQHEIVKQWALEERRKQKGQPT